MYEKWSENAKRSGCLEDLGVDGKMMLKIHINKNFLGGCVPDY
jgi:hypothetical protein